jgi:ribonuclease J
LQVRIHRGATEIGGNCVELQSEGATILLDLGRPLWAEPGQHIPLPKAIGLGEPGPLPLAVILSHGHQDHWGLVPDLPAGIPIWIGQGAADVLRAAEFWGTGIDLHETGHLEHRTPITIGPFTITPYLADHSAFDAYSLLVEASGTRLFYTGDLRGHGRKHRAFDWLVDDPPTDIDVLVLEGTNLRAPHPDHDSHSILGAVVTEADVEAALVATLKETTGLVVVLASAQNIDRLVTVYRAALKAGRRLAVDLYTAEIAAATGRDSIPHLDAEWPTLSTYLPQRQRVRVKQTGQFRRTAAIKPHRIFDEDLTAAPGSWVLFGAFQGHIPHLRKAGLLTGGAVVWSLWDGYLTDTRGQQFVTSLQEAGIPLIHHHTSGHASPSDLKRLVQAMNPVVIVPIHTEAPERFAEVVGGPVILRDDGAWWSA